MRLLRRLGAVQVSTANRVLTAVTVLGWLSRLACGWPHQLGLGSVYGRP